MKLKFKDDFWWGAATSGPQSEGRFNKKHSSVFDHWYDIDPAAFHNYVGPNVASNFYNSFKEDIALMKNIGLNSVRTSIQWTRLIDDFETATLNEDAVRFYNEVIDEFIKNGIRPVMNLHHFDLPIELFEKYGGWESKKVVDLFVLFAQKCFELFSDRVLDWFTFNEPMVIVQGQYLEKFHYPLITDGKKAVQVAYNIQLASAKAIEIFKKTKKNKNARIGIILNLTPAYPASNNQEDLKAAKFAEMFLNGFYMDASIHGKIPSNLTGILEKDKVLFESTEKELDVIKNNTVDYVGLNFYHPLRVKAPSISANSLTVDWLPSKYFEMYEMPGRRMNVDKGWEIYPKALYDIAMQVKNNYNNIDWFVAENGMGVSKEERYLNEQGIIEDNYRIQFIQEHLYWLYQAVSEGSNCFGYHLWTPIDCWSWKNSYRNRYGFISNDIRTQTKTIKKSGYWFKNIAETNKIEVPEQIIEAIK